jgi:hypothetical protein
MTNLPSPRRAAAPSRSAVGRVPFVRSESKRQSRKAKWDASGSRHEPRRIRFRADPQITRGILATASCRLKIKPRPPCRFRLLIRSRDPIPAIPLHDDPVRFGMRDPRLTRANGDGVEAQRRRRRLRDKRSACIRARERAVPVFSVIALPREEKKGGIRSPVGGLRGQCASLWAAGENTIGRKHNESRSPRQRNLSRKSTIHGCLFVGAFKPIS